MPQVSNGQFYDPNNMLSRSMLIVKSTYMLKILYHVFPGIGVNRPTYGTNITSCGHYPYETAQRQVAATHHVIKEEDKKKN